MDGVPGYPTPTATPASHAPRAIASFPDISMRATTTSATDTAPGMREVRRIIAQRTCIAGHATRAAYAGEGGRR